MELSLAGAIGLLACDSRISVSANERYQLLACDTAPCRDSIWPSWTL
jgi:hypothetical protein